MKKSQNRSETFRAQGGDRKRLVRNPTVVVLRIQTKLAHVLKILWAYGQHVREPEACPSPWGEMAWPPIG